MDGNLQAIPGVTIDGASSKDLDDAIWVERKADNQGWVVTVCIANVAKAMEAGSDMDLNACLAGASLYAGTQLYRPMLPAELSHDVLSLLPGRSRFVVSFRMELSATLEQLSFGVCEARFDNHGRLNHQQVSERIRQPGMLQDAWVLASQLLEARRKAGALAFLPDSNGMVTDEEGRSVCSGKASQGQVVVQELMILANCSVAAWMASLGRPMLYRNHTAQKNANRADLAHDVEAAASGGQGGVEASLRLDEQLGRAFLSSVNTGHFGLNQPAYCWATSPIRRYADLIVHRLVLAAVYDKPSPLTAAELDQIASHLNEVAREESKTKSEVFKALRRDQAFANIRRDKLPSLDPSDFRTVIRVFSEEEDMPLSNSFVDEFRSRLSAGTLLKHDLDRVLFAPGPKFVLLRDEVMASLVQDPATGVILVRHLVTTHKVQNMGFQDEHLEDCWACSLICRTRNATITTRRMKGFTRSESRARACVLFLAVMCRPGWDFPAEWSAPWAESSAPKLEMVEPPQPETPLEDIDQADKVA